MTFSNFDVFTKHVTASYADIKNKLYTEEERLYLDDAPFSGVLKKEEEGRRTEQSYFNGKLHGIQKSYYSNGQLKEVTMYTNGEENGRRIEYYACGAKKLNASFCSGHIEGIYEEWNSDGILIMRKTYFNGKLIAIKSN